MEVFVSCSLCIMIFLHALLLANLPTLSFCRLSKELINCSQPFKCGNITNISYPFYGLDRPSYCGHPGFELFGCNQIAQHITMIMKSQTFDVLNINYTTSTITIARDDFNRKSGCPDTLTNITIDFSIFQYTPLDANLTLFYGNCSQLCNHTSSFKEFRCPMSPADVPFCWLTENAMLKSNISEASCPNHLFLPIHSDVNSAMDQAGGFMPAAAWNGFDLRWNANNGSCETCLRSGGQCGHEPRSNKFFCFCNDESKCPFPGSRGYKATLTKSKIALIASCSAVGIGILIFLVFCQRRCSSKDEDTQRKRKRDVEAFLRTHGTVGLQRYTYSELKKMTNSFRDKLGEGGYGAVYKGKTQDNEHLVAVKMLKKSEGNAEDFINEVASIGKTNHINVVSLLGFCYEGRHRALVYDFMPNGSLEKYLYGKNNLYSLAWDELFQIAVGIARGLEYLHRGCNTRILHFDIKPHNILLDKNFCPKISDFGLAKLCPQKESLISISEARGTVGYIAPEVFLRSFGGVSYKSDVYSYGMLVLEMVGCRRKTDIEGSASNNNNSEQYFPQWIYDKLEVGEEFDDQEMLSNDEREIQKKMILVSLWCVKTNPSSRPEMSQVVDMLEGAVESLQVPRIASLAPTSSSLGSWSQSQTMSQSFSMTPTI